MARSRPVLLEQSKQERGGKTTEGKGVGGRDLTQPRNPLEGPGFTLGEVGHPWGLRAEEWYDAAAAKSLQLCPTLCDPIDGSPPGSPVAGILQARTLEWVAIPFSSAWKWKVKVKLLSPVRLFATPWIAAYQALPSMGFSRQEYWSGVPLPSLVIWD